MKDKICMFCGHRTGTNDFFALEAAVTGAILEGCTIFYSGSMGEFDMQGEKAVRRAKSDGFDLKLCTVLPYMKKSIRSRTTASPPSLSMISTTSLLAFG